MDIKQIIRNVPDFPQPGIQFKDITPLLANPEAFNFVIDSLVAPFTKSRIHTVVGMESRGFIFGSAVARQLRAGFVPVRKPNKLPYLKHSVEYALEYGTNTLEIHQDAFPKGSRVLIIDDLLATGGTALAAKQLVEKLHGEVVAFAFVVELGFLKGRERLQGSQVHTLVQY